MKAFWEQHQTQNKRGEYLEKSSSGRLLMRTLELQRIRRYFPANHSLPISLWEMTVIKGKLTSECRKDINQVIFQTILRDSLFLGFASKTS